jgi:predicted nucleic acid-binding protein
VPDTSVLVGYLRVDRHRAFLAAALRRKSLLLPGVVLCALYAGAASPEDRADVEALRRALDPHVLGASKDLPQMTRWSWAFRRLRKPLRVERPHGFVLAPQA